MAAQHGLLVVLVALSVLTWVWRWRADPSDVTLAIAIIYKTPVLSLFTLLVCSLLYGLVGRSMGIANLYWNDHPLTRFCAAAAVTVSLAVIATLMFLSYSIDRASQAFRPGQAITLRAFTQFHSFMLLFGIPAIALVLAPAVAPRWFPFVPRSAVRSLGGVGQITGPPDIVRNPSAWRFALFVWVAGVAAGVTLFATLIAGVEALQSALVFIFRQIANVDTDLSKQRYFLMYAIWVLVFVGLYAVLGRVDRVYERVSPPVAICALLVLVAFAYALVEDVPDWPFAAGLDTRAYVYFVPLVRISIVIALVAWFCAANQDAFKLRFPGMEMYYERPVVLGRRVKEVYIRENRVVEWAPQPDDGFELRLLSRPQAEEMPPDGKNLIVVADTENGMRFRVFDRHGTKVEDVGENELKGRLRGIERLKQQLGDAWPPRQPARIEAHRITSAVKSIVGYAPDPEGCPEARLVQDVVVLENWFRNVTGREPWEAGSLSLDRRPKLALVAVSGGGARSALWSAVVLDRLDRMIPRFREHVRIITGASGGMLGAAYFLRCCRDDLPKSPEPPSAWVNDVPLASIRPVARHLALRGPWIAWLPWGRAILPHDDAGIQLEKDWGRIDFALQSLLPLEEEGKIPSIILSPMIVEDGRRLLINTGGDANPIPGTTTQAE
jgi:hypothetical protein